MDLASQTGGFLSRVFSVVLMRLASVAEKPIMTRKVESEEAKILAMIASARDKPESTAEDLARKAGRPKTADPKRPVSLRLDADLLAAMKQDGEGWQTRLNDKLRKIYRLKTKK
ncbi:BrnA antitoxin family protein [Paracoccus litorisediminis]|uniref:BrnA antitoxin family protein n=1 Tax=Paracoccus litorisediminis TaxID=2006130 RepID=UPI00373487CF